MNIEIQRFWYTSVSTCGIMSFDGTFFCYTMEPAEGPTLIPAGTYRAAKSQTFSPRLIATLNRLGLPPITPRLHGVPGWPNEDVEIHMGNVPEETEGCTLVGATHSINLIGNSDLTFVKLMQRLPDDFEITYRDTPKTGVTDETLGIE